MSPEETRTARGLLTALAGAATLAAPALPGAGAAIARVIAAGLGAAAAMIDQGATLEEATHRIHRVRRIDTTATDAAARAKADALPSSAEPDHPED